MKRTGYLRSALVVLAVALMTFVATGCNGDPDPDHPTNGKDHPAGKEHPDHPNK